MKRTLKYLPLSTRRLGIFVALSALYLLAVAPASADNGPHVKNAGVLADTCAACHRAHTAQAPSLLKQPQESLCFTCHGTSATGADTDVQDGIGYSGAARSGGVSGALRAGGFSYALIDSSNPSGPSATGVIPTLSAANEQPTTSTHSINLSNQTAWGNGAISASINYGSTISLRCGSCHDPHGNGNYRILRPIPKDSGAASPGVVIPDPSNKVYTTNNYWQVSDPNTPEFLTNIAGWCTTCHSRYLSGSGGGKTSSGDAVYTYRHRSDYAAAGKPNCIQCHVAHGSNATMGPISSSVPFPDGSSAGDDSRLLRINNRGTCQMCHNK